MALHLQRVFDLGFTAENVKLPIQPTPPASEKDAKKSDGTKLAGGALIGLASASLLPLLALFLVLITVAALMDFLRKRQNPTYWQAACWVLVTMGILARQLFAPSHQLDLSQLSPSLVLGSAIISLAVLPLLMRWLNKVSPGPSLIHVALPFSLGFFLDYGQVLTSHYIVHLPWVANA